MSKKIKLNCPMCNIEFITNKRNRIWCNKQCSDSFRDLRNRVEKNIENNKRLQKRIDNVNYRYDFDSNKYFLINFF